MRHAHKHEILRAAWVTILLAGAGLASNAEAELASMYAIDFLGTASDGIDMNEQGVAIGVRSIDVGCGPNCLAPTEEVVWTGGDFLALPWLPQWDNVYLEGMNNNGWIVGTAYAGPDGRGIVWKPVDGGYEIIEIGNLPDTDSSSALGIDDRNRVVGFANRLFPFADKPFMWTQADGLTDLTELGFPGNHPEAISPAGTVAYLYGWYQLDVPGVFMENSNPPDGFRGPGAYFAINDAGDQIRLIARTSGENINYPFRYLANGTWQQLWPNGGIDASPFGVGSITSNLDISLTISSTGLVAAGPGGLAQDMTDLLSPAYDDAYVVEGGPMNERGEILGEVMIGRSPRTVRFVAAESCVANCTRVSAMRLRARFVHDPADPDHCTDIARTRANVVMQITDEAGAPLAGAQVSGRFLDDYWLDGIRRGTTNSQGVVRFFHDGPSCVGAVAFLVTDATLADRAFDRTSGVLQQWTIPLVP